MINSKDVLGTAKIKKKNLTHQQHRDARQQKDITARLAITAIIMICFSVSFSSFSLIGPSVSGSSVTKGLSIYYVIRYMGGGVFPIYYNIT